MVTSPGCPKCECEVPDPAAVHSIHDPLDPTRIEAKVYTFTCHASGMSFTVEVKEAEAASNK